MRYPNPTPKKIVGRKSKQMSNTPFIYANSRRNDKSEPNFSKCYS